ncbi:hypothetical protein BUE93_05810 [Chromobacterium amazonense]|uniref:Uncharacterized protein n=1 Tax=Chromobacterium amazonense TaxID=1382803 RepID=A0A2S9X745_9NEIS|nr:hypothetical protein [Chromobacterium amazonense]PRP71513.1 hypothetical protein BUE93_05810 [Chromobacterium amazonense]
MRIHHAGDHQAVRRQRYPDPGDQLDAIWKALAQLPGLPPEARDMLEHIRHIKTQYPKPRNCGASAFTETE